MTIHFKKYQLWLLVILSGLLMGLAWPVNGFSPLIFIAWIPLLFVRNYILQNPTIFSRGAVVLYSYFSFLIFNLFTTWWVAYSTIEGAAMAFLLNSLFMALTFGLAHIIDKHLFSPKTGFFVLIFFWLSYEYLHMNWDLTWSWLNMGNVFSENPQWVQWYEYTGVLGGSIWVIVVNLLIFSAIKKYQENKKKFKIIIPNLLFVFLIVFTPIIISSIILHRGEIKTNESINVLLIQPNIEPYFEAYETSSEDLINNILNIVRENADSSTELIITPESSIERSMWESKIDWYPAIDSVRNYLYEHPKYSFIIGASTRRELQANEEIKAYAREFYNSPGKYYYRYNTALFIKNNSKIEFYHKAKLVPGVERLPFAAILKPMEKFAINLGGTTGSLGVSTEPSVFKISDNKVVAPTICYESVYGEFLGNFANYGSGFIAVITNDAWWYNSPGHKQHFSYARLRAIENKQYVVRAANTGISGVIDNYGNVLQKTIFYERTAVKAKIPLNYEITYYAKNGDYLGRLSVFMIAFFALIALARRLMKRPSQL